MIFFYINSGTAANDIHFQAYVIEGIVRWNSQRAIAALDSPDSTIRSFDPKLRLKLKSLHSAVLDKSTDTDYHPPAAYTGELFGIEYLYSEIGLNVTLGANIDLEIEEGLDIEDTMATTEEEGSLDSEMDVAANSFLQANSEDTHSDSGEVETQFVDIKSIDGWDKVAQLVVLLAAINSPAISTLDAEKIVQCYDNLSPYDKKPISYGRTIKSPKGRFGRSKNQGGHVGVDAMKRCFLSAGCPSLPPSKSRVVEAICVHLFNTISSPQKTPNYVSRYALILQRYNLIKYAVAQSPIILEKTGLVLFQINETTVSKW